MTFEESMDRYSLTARELNKGIGSVRATVRTLGNYFSACYCRKSKAGGFSLHILRSIERRRPQMPTAVPFAVQSRVLVFSIANPGLGPIRIAAKVAHPRCKQRTC